MTRLSLAFAGRATAIVVLMTVSVIGLATRVQAQDVVYIAATLPGGQVGREEGAIQYPGFTGEIDQTSGLLCYTLVFGGDTGVNEAVLERVLEDGSYEEIVTLPVSDSADTNCVSLTIGQARYLQANPENHRISIATVSGGLERYSFDG